MNWITFGAGALYIEGEKMGECSDIKFTEESDEAKEFFDFKRLGCASEEFSASIKMTTNAFTRFVHVVTGIDKHLMQTCPNNRVVHLAYHARKSRVRKKNYNRMIKMCERNA